jgi:hypothetical protein
VSRGRPGTRRTRNVIGIIAVIGVIGSGAVLFGLGLSGFANVHALAASGVPTLGRVSATSGYGKTSIQVTYQVDGRPGPRSATDSIRSPSPGRGFSIRTADHGLDMGMSPPQSPKDFLMPSPIVLGQAGLMHAAS